MYKFPERRRCPDERLERRDDRNNIGNGITGVKRLCKKAGR